MVYKAIVLSIEDQFSPENTKANPVIVESDRELGSHQIRLAAISIMSIRRKLMNKWVIIESDGLPISFDAYDWTTCDRIDYQKNSPIDY